MRLILASASPRRAELLRAAGFDFQVLAVDVDERVLPKELPPEHVRRLAAEKSARALQLLSPAAPWSSTGSEQPVPRGAPSGALAGTPGPAPEGLLVLGADTVVVVDDEILGKPSGAADARRMLSRLSGRSHQVLTGVSLRTPTHEMGCVETTTVWFVGLGTDEVDWYVQTGEGQDKAGAYAIQGLASRFVTRIDGSYSNVVGLPVAAVYRLGKLLSGGGRLGPDPVASGG
jgi:septum formation protein